MTDKEERQEPHSQFVNREIALEELRVWYIEELAERITDPKEKCGPRECSALEEFARGGTLPSAPYFRDFLSYIIQRDRIRNRHELYEATRCWFE